MELITQLFGHGKDLSVLQMSLRTVVVFIICLSFIRIAGKRTFGMRMPLDNVITILLGAILSRAIVGASPFIPTVVSGLVIVLLYFIFAQLSVISDFFGCIVKGKATVLYKDGQLFRENMRRCMVTEKDLVEGVRINSNLDSLDKIETIHVERNGEISVVKKTD